MGRQRGWKRRFSGASATKTGFVVGVGNGERGEGAPQLRLMGPGGLGMVVDAVRGIKEWDGDNGTSHTFLTSVCTFSRRRILQKWAATYFIG